MNAIATRNHLTVTQPVVSALLAEVVELVSCGTPLDDAGVASVLHAVAVILTGGEAGEGVGDTIEVIEVHAADLVRTIVTAEPGEGLDPTFMADHLIASYV